MNSDLSDSLVELPSERVAAFEQAGGLMLTALLTAGIGFVAGRRQRGGWLALSAVSLAVAGGLIWLFRNPHRATPADADAIIAISDGRITAITPVITPVTEARFLHGPGACIEIATAPYQVQVNWAPCSGIVAYRRYELGSQHPEVERDDSNWLGLERADGARLLLRQIAARCWRPVPWHLARKIICWPDLSDRVVSGEVIGHLPLGGITQVYVPAQADLAVRHGQQVRGGETVLARLAAKPAP